jgi:LemA protein
VLEPCKTSPKVRRNSRRNPQVRVEWLIAAAIAAVLLFAVVIFNRLVRLRNMVREGWSGIDVQLKRRTDLIPNLVETVKSYAAHERSVLEDVTRLRATSVAATGVQDQANAAQALSGSLNRLMALAEAYPQLKADQNFLQLQQQLADTEDQIQMARRYYNGAARNLNIAIQSFPAVLIAGPLGFREQPFFELENRAESQAPQISFPGGKP